MHAEARAARLHPSRRTALRIASIDPTRNSSKGIDVSIRNYFDAAQRRIWNIAIRLEMMRERDRNIDDYTRRVNALHRRLRVPRDYARRGLPFYREASNLVAVPCGPDGKHRLMAPAIRSQWLAMQAGAAAAGITLFVRAAFRSVDDQAQLIRDQLSSGGRIDQLLTWIAAPGYSEHHTGRALDIDCTPTRREFEHTPGFDWLCRNAGEFRFKLSYPQDNAYGIMYEPWHWCCHSEETSHLTAEDSTRGER